MGKYKETMAVNPTSVLILKNELYFLQYLSVLSIEATPTHPRYHKPLNSSKPQGDIKFSMTCTHIV